MQKLWIVTLMLFSHVVLGAESIGTILGVVGSVTVHHENKVITAQRKTPLYESDVIVSGKEARAQLRFVDGTLTTIGANTSMTISAFVFQEKNKPNNAEFKLLSGAFRTVSGELIKTKGSQFHVQTPVGSIGIRGTDFWGGYLGADDIEVLLIDGEHAVEVKNMHGSVVLKKPGEGTTLKQDQTAPQVKIWPQAKVDKAVATIKWPTGSAPTQ